MLNCLPPILDGKETRRLNSSFAYLPSENYNQTIISSDPVQVLPCDERYCVTYNHNKSEPRELIVPAVLPGQEFRFRVAAVGQINRLTPTTILLNSDDITFERSFPVSAQRIEGACTTVNLR